MEESNQAVYRAKSIQNKKALIEAVYNMIGIRYPLNRLTIAELKGILKNTVLYGEQRKLG